MEQEAVQPTSVSLSAVVIRADGTRIDLGVIGDSTWAWYKPHTWIPAWTSRRRIIRANKGVTG